jgi:rod shape-determining protein MreD
MLWLILALLLAVLVQSGVFPGLIAGGVRLELPLLLVVGWAMLRGWEEGLLVGLLGGFLTDIVSAAPFGVNVVGMGAVGAVAGIAMTRVAHTSPVLPVLAATSGSLLAFAVSVFGLQAAGWVVHWERALILQALPTALLSGLCMAAIFPALRGLDAFLSREPAVDR